MVRTLVQHREVRKSMTDKLRFRLRADIDAD